MSDPKTKAAAEVTRFQKCMTFNAVNVANMTAKQVHDNCYELPLPLLKQVLAALVTEGVLASHSGRYTHR